MLDDEGGLDLGAALDEATAQVGDAPDHALLLGDGVGVEVGQHGGDSSQLSHHPLGQPRVLLLVEDELVLCVDDGGVGVCGRGKDVVPREHGGVVVVDQKA